LHKGATKPIVGVFAKPEPKKVACAFVGARVLMRSFQTASTGHKRCWDKQDTNPHNRKGDAKGQRHAKTRLCFARTGQVIDEGAGKNTAQNAQMATKPAANCSSRGRRHSSRHGEWRGDCGDRDEDGCGCLIRWDCRLGDPGFADG